VFTGIVESMGRVIRVLRRGGGARLEIRAPGISETFKAGDSVAVNGACLTVTVIEGDAFAADLVPETLARTNLGMLQPGEEVNIERPMRSDGRFDGHIVQGHVDVVGVVRSRRKVGAQEMLEVNIPFELTRYLAPKGSIGVDGVSLTLVDVNKDRFRVALIPHTIATTTLGRKIQGHTVNVEVDILSKYVERHIMARMPRPTPSLAELVRGPRGDGELHPAAPAPAIAKPAAPAAPTKPAPAPAPKMSSKPPQKPKAPMRRPPPRKKVAAASANSKKAAPKAHTAKKAVPKRPARHR
jgi:riboflavin synthase